MAVSREKTLLLAEDDKFIARTLINELTREGIRVIHVFNGEQALEMLSHEHVDVVLLDLMMPQMNGFEFLTERKLKKIGENVPVIVLSNLDQDADKVRVLKLGAKEYLVKAHSSLGHIVERVKEMMASS